jgi:hypothetical protein
VKLFIPSHGRAATVRTHIYANGFFDYWIVLHSEEEARWYRKNKSIDPARIVVSGMPLGLGGQRNWILENLVEDGEWFGMFDDNIDGFSGVTGELYNDPKHDVDTFTGPFWRKIYSASVSPYQLSKICEESIQMATTIGARLVGFSVTDNYYFRRKKWQAYGYVSTKAAIIQKTRLRFDPFFKAKDDHDFTAANLTEYGKVLINNYVFPLAGHFEPGGIGNKATRMELCVKESARLVEKYPDLWRLRDKKSMAPKAEVVLLPGGKQKIPFHAIKKDI